MKAVPFESFSYPFFDFSFKADHAAVAEAYLNPPGELPTARGRKGLYIHIPFCDSICRFCPFVKSVGSAERIAAYVTALETELRLVGATRRIGSWVIDSVYVGGGTPSVLDTAQMERLFTALRENLRLSADCEITFEMEAKSVSRERLLCLRELGVTRVSFGLQTFDQQIRPYLHLTATEEQLLGTIALFREIFPDNNMDIITGLPGQTAEAMYRDLERAAASGISSVSIYPMDYVMTNPFLLNQIRCGAIPAPADPLTRSAMFYDARQYLKRHFSEYNIYSYGNARSTPSRYMFATVYGNYFDEFLGVGASAYTYVRGLIYQNAPVESEYVQLLGQGLSPVRVASPYAAYEKGLVFFPKRMSFQLDELSQLDLHEIYGAKIDALIEQGLLWVDGPWLRLTPQGERNYAALMVEFFSESQRRLYRKICQRLKEQIGWDETVGAIEAPPRTRQYGGVTAMAAGHRADR